MNKVKLKFHMEIKITAVELPAYELTFHDQNKIHLKCKHFEMRASKSES